MKNLTFLFLLFAVTLQAQDGKFEKIKALKTAFITEKLALTASEAEKFWPVYNSFDEKFHQLRKKERNEVYKYLNNHLDNLTNAEANELIEKELTFESDRLKLKKQRTADLRKVLSAKQIIILNKTENDFKRELLDRYKHGKDNEKRN